MRSTVFLIVAMALAGCQSITNTLPPDTTAADVIKDSATLSEVKSLPAPMGQIPVSVYAFRDQTGQYKPSTGASSFSTAVTQGATSILVQTLSETSWFYLWSVKGCRTFLPNAK